MQEISICLSLDLLILFYLLLSLNDEIATRIKGAFIHFSELIFTFSFEDTAFTSEHYRDSMKNKEKLREFNMP